MKYNLKDLLHAINVINEDRDVYVDGNDVIAVCPPVSFTPEGLKHFEKALSAPIDENADVVGESEEQCDTAWKLLASLAGYCSESQFKEWFEGETATEI